MNGLSASRKRRRLLPALELEVMKVLWEREKANVRDVQQALSPERQLAYTTVMTLLDRLYRKGAVSRRKQGRSYRYEPELDREVALDQALDRFVRDFFGNSREQLLAYLQQNPTPAEDGEETQDLDSVLL